jgi:hypothetical protein
MTQLVPFKTADEAMAARNVAKACVHFEASRIAAMTMADCALGEPFNRAMAELEKWRACFDYADSEFQRLQNAYYDQLEVRNGG